jgi:ribosome assembly protein 1
MAVQHLPNPIEAQEKRIGKLWRPLAPGSSEEIKMKHEKILQSMLKCDTSDDSEVVIFVSKMFAVTEDNLIPMIRKPQPRTIPGGETPTPITTKKESSSEETKRSSLDSDGKKFIAFARIFSGHLRKGCKIHVLGPRYDPLVPSKYHTETIVDEIYLLMGRALEQIEHIPAGNVFGIGGLADHILKSATLSTSEACTTFNIMQFTVRELLFPFLLIFNVFKLLTS